MAEPIRGNGERRRDICSPRRGARRGHPGSVRHDRAARHGRAPIVESPTAHAARDHGPRAHRDGRGQRRGRCVDLRASRAELRAQLALDLPLLIPVLIVNQEMVVRLGAVTGVGHARLINERFGRFWGWFSVGDLFILNFLTIATEFIGVSLALDYFGVSHYISVPIAAALLVVMTATGSFQRWERFMLVFVVANFLVIPLAIFSHPHAGAFFHGLVVPGVSGGFNSTSVLLVIAIVGTTVAPWQLFFQQSNIVDKRITPRWINYERTDTVIGSLITVFAASLIIALYAPSPSLTRRSSGTSPMPGGSPPDLSHFVGHGAGSDVRGHPAQRVHHRRCRGDACDVLRVR